MEDILPLVEAPPGPKGAPIAPPLTPAPPSTERPARPTAPRPISGRPAPPTAPPRTPATPSTEPSARPTAPEMPPTTEVQTHEPPTAPAVPDAAENQMPPPPPFLSFSLKRRSSDGWHDEPGESTPGASAQGLSPGLLRRLSHDGSTRAVAEWRRALLKTEATALAHSDGGGVSEVDEERRCSGGRAPLLRGDSHSDSEAAEHHASRSRRGNGNALLADGGESSPAQWPSRDAAACRRASRRASEDIGTAAAWWAAQPAPPPGKRKKSALLAPPRQNSWADGVGLQTDPPAASSAAAASRPGSASRRRASATTFRVLPSAPSRWIRDADSAAGAEFAPPRLPALRETSANAVRQDAPWPAQSAALAIECAARRQLARREATARRARRRPPTALPPLSVEPPRPPLPSARSRSRPPSPGPERRAFEARRAELLARGPRILASLATDDSANGAISADCATADAEAAIEGGPAEGGLPDRTGCTPPRAQPHAAGACADSRVLATPPDEVTPGQAGWRAHQRAIFPKAREAAAAPEPPPARTQEEDPLLHELEGEARMQYALAKAGMLLRRRSSSF